VSVTVTTTGSGSDADGYSLSLAGQQEPVAVNSTTTFLGVAAGSQNAVLSTVADHCRSDALTVPVTVIAGTTVTAQIDVECFGGFAVQRSDGLDFRDGDGNLVDLTPNFAGDVGAWEWSPDGSQIVFEVDDGSQTDLWTVRADGTGLGAITQTAALNEVDPHWAPDGTRLAFAQGDSPGLQIATMNPDGSGLLTVTTAGETDSDPRWSPDGLQILFTSTRGGDDQSWVMAPDGSALTQLFAEKVAHASWSPDGTQIAFESHRDGNQEIYVMQADGSNQTNLTNRSRPDIEPVWVADGDSILFAATGVPLDSLHIFTMATDGSSITQLTMDSGWLNYRPSISTDGQYILFTSDRTPPGVYVMERDGSSVHLLRSFVERAKWQPIP
jgi:TolB protein